MKKSTYSIVFTKLILDNCWESKTMSEAWRRMGLVHNLYYGVVAIVELKRGFSNCLTWYVEWFDGVES